MKIKRILFKFLKEENMYLILKSQNVKGFSPGNKIFEEELNKLYNSDIEVVVKWIL